jgi:lipid II:glycine glycyltransferase (peptidoglycan interpeptide bridge formation enzyme)
MKKDIRILSDNIDKKQWEELLNISPYGNFFQTYEAFSFFSQLKQSIEPHTIAVSVNGKLKGLITAVVYKESGLIKSFLTKRAIIYGGPVLSPDITDQEFSALLSAAIKILKKHSIYLEIRNLNNYKRYRHIFETSGFIYKEHLNYKVSCDNRETMLSRMSKSKKRQIKKGLKEGAEIIEAQNREEVTSFYDILKTLYREKIKTPLPPIGFFLAFFEKKLGKYFLIKYNNDIIGGIMCPVFNKRTIYEWYVCGKDQEYKNLYPSILATWAAMDYANNNDIEIFDFMGAGAPDKDYGVREFKSKFGGELVEHGRFLYIANPILYKIGAVGVSILKKFK